MIKSQPGWLGPGFELGTSQIRVECVATAPTRWRSFCFVEYHHFKDFAASKLKRKISSLSCLTLLLFFIFISIQKSFFSEFFDNIFNFDFRYWTF